MSSSLKGQFLVAVPKMRDPNFYKTVVLLVEHGQEGAMGLVVNRPSTTSVSKALSGHFDFPENGEFVFTGGPVEPAALFMIHNAQELDPQESSVIDGLYMGSSARIFEDVIAARLNGDAVHFRIYSGCAGWGPQQLEGEMSRGDWLTIPACRELVLADDPYSVWDAAMQNSQSTRRLLDIDCEHPEWN